MKYTYRIKSKARFSIFIAVIILLSVLLGFIMIKNNKSIKSSYDSIAKVRVAQGDTLWHIASRSLPKNRDIRDYISEIIEANGLNSANIIEGQYLNIPIYPEPSKPIYLKYIENDEAPEVEVGMTE